MKPIVTGMVLIALFTNVLCYAQNNTPMEVLVNIANDNARFIPKQIFIEDHRNTDYLDSYLTNYATLKLNESLLNEIVTQELPNIAVALPLPDGKSLNARLVNFDIRTEEFSVVDQFDNELEIPDAQFYRGVLDRESDAMAGISFFRDRVYGLFSSLSKGNIILAQDPINPGNGENYILYYERDLLIDREKSCGTDDLKPFDDYQSVTSRSTGNVYSSCEDIEVYIEATNKLYQKMGSSTAVTNYITAFFNSVSIIYRNEGIYTSIKRIKVNTTEDGYTNLTTSFDNLNKFGENTKNNYQQYGAELAHLVDYNENNLGGVAWINAMCINYIYYPSQNYHYGGYAYSSINNTHEDFPDYSLTVFMFAHEMGHNLGSQHTQWCGWTGGPIDNCVSVEGTCDPGPAPVNGGTIMSYCHLTEYGINYSEGFGEIPGNHIRSILQSKTCKEEYVPKGVVNCNPNTTVTANRECTDEDGWTHYYFDNNSTDEDDDDLLLSVLKGSEDIGDLDDGSLIVRVKTSSNAGNGATHIVDPGYSAGDDWYVMNRWFELIPTEEPNNPVTVRFPYTTEDYMDVIMTQPAVNAHQDLIFYKINTPGNPDPDSGHKNITNDQITFYENGTTASLNAWKYIKNGTSHMAEFQVSSFSGGGGGFSETSQSAVPVEILTYDVQKEGKFVSANWSTSLEINNEYFTVERSSDGKVFEEIGRISGQGNSSELQEYSFLDRNPNAGINYYRLSQTDFDGTHVVIGVRSIKMDFIREINVFPNPLASDQLNINYSLTNAEDISVVIRNIEGRMIYQTQKTSEIGKNQMSMDLSHVDAGIYIVQIVSGKETYTQKLIKD
ncbi:zinc-dependent metalloprotease [Portibacter lacus]|uniref:Peptidase M12B domain-containing protein n=1 Tax=Portibacter lacus TaxID=1099794 RepID=A0AA37SMI8_9BACT|nr:zinc-dependent metalloprotease [Portibacter lacus]GLR17438.1 hypothetical protein GCM10007940_20530 [Portibacter lacus]